MVNKKRLEKGYKPINIGIGINTGFMALGTIGEEERMETTVISDAVNQAARMESLTKTYGAKILLSLGTLNSINAPDKYSYRLVDVINLRGKNEPTFVIELLDCLPDEEKNLKMKTKPELEKAISFFRDNKVKESYEILNNLLEINTNDAVLKIYISKCEDLLKK